jgi:hypothetical protein
MNHFSYREQTAGGAGLAGDELERLALTVRSVPIASAIRGLT